MLKTVTPVRKIQPPRRQELNGCSIRVSLPPYRPFVRFAFTRTYADKSCTLHGASTEADKAAWGQLSCVGWCSHAAARILLKWEERMYPGYQPKPDDVFHAVGYTTRDISDNTHFHLHGISDRVRMENENLWRQLGPLVRAM